MANIRLGLAYDGTAYLGWQKTTTGPSIEEALEKALRQILQEECLLQAASRTDAGVHAEGQVVNFKTQQEFSLTKFLHSLNGILPKDISIHSVEEAPEHFHPTLDSKGKEYHYHLCLGPVQLPFYRTYSWHFFYPLNLELMKEAAKELIGTHDFSAFRNVQKKGQKSDPIRTLTSIDFILLPENRLRIAVQGESFLYKMVRNLVGTLVYIGCGKLPENALPALLKGKDRTEIGMTAPAHGLVLKKVLY